MFKNAAKTATQYRAGLMATPTSVYEKYCEEAIKALAEKIDQDAMRAYAGISAREAMVANMPTEGAKRAARRLIDAALGAKHPSENLFDEYRKWRDAERRRG